MGSKYFAALSSYFKGYQWICLWSRFLVQEVDVEPLNSKLTIIFLSWTRNLAKNNQHKTANFYECCIVQCVQFSSQADETHWFFLIRPCNGKEDRACGRSQLFPPRCMCSCCTPRRNPLRPCRFSCEIRLVTARDLTPEICRFSCESHHLRVCRRISI